jgi:hypothetical protein
MADNGFYPAPYCNRFLSVSKMWFLIHAHYIKLTTTSKPKIRFKSFPGNKHYYITKIYLTSPNNVAADEKKCYYTIPFSLRF